ncbi:MAG TPA: YdeI/OmpD-associated family protein [Aggregatilinea sp.]|uniref:YdeI/OmpD-associated family protein n=1 Tax=Aggregatilinea sp. TaxID=2806333 RepID=UPI002CEB9027|nr:YdeI/OmpD-associated family protein [Aggregatilinea sp.]HML24860.1 YdeI/OmpD-associated family protein [Aggregatilinea sp.]
MDVTFFETPDDFRAWLDANHDSVTELWVGYYKKGTGKPSMTWPESVDQALCYGWIDGIRKSVDDESYTNRFTPRRPGSNWSEVNIKRVEELSAQGLMQPAGLRAFEARDHGKRQQYSYEARHRDLDPALEAQFRSNEPAWAFFQSQAPSYRKVVTGWVMSAKRDETRQKRLAELIDVCASGERLPQFMRRK